MDVVDDSDDAGVSGHEVGQERERRLAALHVDDDLPGPGPDSVRRQDGRAAIRQGSAHGLKHEELGTGEPRVLVRRDDASHHASEVHDPTLTAGPQGFRPSRATVSTMPTMDASVGESFVRAVIRADEPVTIRPTSPLPAWTVSTATTHLPLSRPASSSGCTTRSLHPSRRSSFRVATTVPTTLARYTSGIPSRGAYVRLVLPIGSLSSRL